MSVKETLVIVCDECGAIKEVECSHDIAILVKFDGWEEREPDDEHEPQFDGDYHRCPSCRGSGSTAGGSAQEEASL